MRVLLRPVRDADLPALFELERDPEAVRMAAFTPKDPSDREAFLRFWSRLRADPAVVVRTVEVDAAVAGTVATYPSEGRTEVTYWIGRTWWGRGIATAAVRALLGELGWPAVRARVAADNAASIRVLEKTGFRMVGGGKGFANGRGEEIDEYLMERSAGPLPGFSGGAGGAGEPA